MGSEFELSQKDVELYAGQWIAILNSKVIANSRDVEKVYKNASKITNESVLFEYVYTNHETIIC